MNKILKKNLVKIILSSIVMLMILVTFSGISIGKEKVTLNFWIMGAGPTHLRSAVDTMVADFEKENSDMEVIVQYIPWGSAYDKIMTSVAGGIAPEVIEAGTTWTPGLAEMGVLMDLDAKIDAWGNRDDLLPGLVESATYNGRLYAMPWYAGCRALIYRKDWFEKEGIAAPPKPPEVWTWDEFLKAAIKLNNPPDRWGFGVFAGEMHQWLPLIWQNGGEIAIKIPEGYYKATINEPNAVEALTFYTDLFLKYGLSPQGCLIHTAKEGRKGFAMGKYAIVFGGAWWLPTIEKFNPEIKGKYAVALLPKRKEAATFVGGSNLVIFQESKYADEAWKFVEFLLNKENQLTFAKTVGMFPARMSVFETPYYSEYPLNVFAEQLKVGKVYPVTPEWGQIEATRILFTMIENILMGKKTVQEAADDTAVEMDKVFKRL